MNKQNQDKLIALFSLSLSPSFWNQNIILNCGFYKKNSLYELSFNCYKLFFVIFKYFQYTNAQQRHIEQQFTITSCGDEFLLRGKCFQMFQDFFLFNTSSAINKCFATRKKKLPKKGYVTKFLMIDSTPMWVWMINRTLKKQKLYFISLIPNRLIWFS